MAVCPGMNRPRNDHDFLTDHVNHVANPLEQNQLDYIRNMPPVGIEAYWMDAGWFVGGWPFGVGNWDPDPKKFRHGLKSLGDAAHQKGLKFLQWFEPERVSPGTAIEKQHRSGFFISRMKVSGGQIQFWKLGGSPVDQTFSHVCFAKTPPDRK